MAEITEARLVDSIADALHYGSYLHPQYLVRALADAYERHSVTVAVDAPESAIHPLGPRRRRRRAGLLRPGEGGIEPLARASEPVAGARGAAMALPYDA